MEQKSSILNVMINLLNGLPIEQRRIFIFNNVDRTSKTRGLCLKHGIYFPNEEGRIKFSKKKNCIHCKHGLSIVNWIRAWLPYIKK